MTIERHLKLILIALIRQNNGEITIRTDTINSIDFRKEIEETTNPDGTLTLREF